ncbi:unnamed protein product [Rotaria sordida]|uniref:Uncharacterized protein n=1 Tax=Rotaria sordida TaxID=392033 RepID=A0A815X859_9BILA|nr:unnamed protein product [Rotaria sordida]CAF1554210.1 unnamed protein product [Rotaria sordida]
MQSCPPNVLIQRLSIADAKLVDDLWEYKSPFSLGCILYQIEHLPTFGAYHAGQLVSWSLTQFDDYVNGRYYSDQDSLASSIHQCLNSVSEDEFTVVIQKVLEH